MRVLKDTFELNYSILDPTGNITALVEDPVEIDQQPAVADALMRLHTEVEQVGFVRYYEDPKGKVRGELRMAGGEFCGNASMSAAALYLLGRKMKDGSDDIAAQVFLEVSGAKEAVEVRLLPSGKDSFLASIRMPEALEIVERDFSFGDLSGSLPVVMMEGISHIVIEEGSVFYELKDKKKAAEDAIRNWCAELEADGLGLMFLKGSGTNRFLTPLVYIPGSATVFWEHSCASGSAAVGMYLGRKTGEKTKVVLQEPGGCLTAENDPLTGKTILGGQVRLTGRFGP